MPMKIGYIAHAITLPYVGHCDQEHNKPLASQNATFFSARCPWTRNEGCEGKIERSTPAESRLRTSSKRRAARVNRHHNSTMSEDGTGGSGRANANTWHSRMTQLADAPQKVRGFSDPSARTNKPNALMLTWIVGTRRSNIASESECTAQSELVPGCRSALNTPF